jgi:hypothetical protein
MKVYVIKRPYFWQTKKIETVCFDIYAAEKKDDPIKLMYNRIIQNVDVARDYAKQLRIKHKAEIQFIDKTK